MDAFFGMTGPGSSLSVVNFGEEMCRSRHGYGPAMRIHYLMHYVKSGMGILSAGGKTWKVCAGEAFLIYPGEITTYQADEKQPWHYAWVGFSGKGEEELVRLCGFSRGNRVVRTAREDDVWQAMMQLIRDASELRLGRLAALGGLYRIASLLAPLRDETVIPDHTRHYEKALWFMQGAYSRPVKVQEIADFVGLSRSQLFRIFEKSCGQSPKQVLQEMRLQQVRMLLQDTALTVEQIALATGFHSAGHLGAAFREKYGLSPREYRQG